ncbi:MAG: amidase family protein [Microthrixaceae bacterium]|nr:amidase family protein [Microthrixaceae bacterium]
MARSGWVPRGLPHRWSTITAGAAALDEDLLEPHNRANREMALATNAIAYSEAVMDLQMRSRGFTEAFGTDFDVLLTPTMAVEPPEVGSIWAGSQEDPSAPLTNATPMAAYTALYNVTGQPAISSSGRVLRYGPAHRRADRGPAVR